MPRIPPKGRPFQKGQSGNPEGARAHNQDLKKLRRLTREQVVEIGSLVLEKKVSELRRIARSKKAPSLQAWFAAVAYRAIMTGDATHYDRLLDRIIGKVKDEIKFEGSLKVREKYKRMSTEELAAELSERSAKLARITRGK